MINLLHKSSVLLFLAFVATSLNAQDDQGIKSERIKLEWATDRVFEVPESVIYDPEKDILYVGNINGKPTDKDGNGYISTMTTRGEVISKMWITGLDAPKGMGIYKGMLYVTDIDRLVKIDIDKGAIVNEYPYEGAKFLNDIAIDKKGKVYVSDMMDTKIYRLYGDDFEVWMDDPLLTSPNGLWAGDDHLFVGCKKILRVNLRDLSAEIVSGETGGIDGLEGTADGGFLFSDWSGNVHYLSPAMEIEHLINTSEMNVNAADIEFIPSMNLILVPTFFDNRVMAYSFSE